MPPNTPPQDSPQETTRRVENIARLGTVMAVRYTKPARCRVQLGQNTTDWIPWLAGRAAGQNGSHWWPPAVGEQCLVLSPGGDMSQGVALIGAYSDQMDAPGDEGGVEITQWNESNYAEYRDGQYKVRTELAIVLEVGTSIIHITPNSITLRGGGATLQIGPKKITANVDIVAEGISLVHHVHGGVEPGDATTEAPQ